MVFFNGNTGVYRVGLPYGLPLSTHPRTSLKLMCLPTLTSSRHHTTANSCSLAKPSVLHTVHRGRLFQNCQFHCVHPRDLHFPRLFTWC